MSKNGKWKIIKIEMENILFRSLLLIFDQKSLKLIFCIIKKSTSALREKSDLKQLEIQNKKINFNAEKDVFYQLI